MRLVSSLSWIRGHPITVSFSIVFVMLLVAILASLLLVAGFGIKTEIKQKHDAVEYQLKRLLITFNSSEGQQVLGNLMIGNLSIFDKIKRPFTPIYLPKRNWVDLPSTPNLQIEDTPRSCKLYLRGISHGNEETSIIACAYITDGIRVKGVYLYLNLSYKENELVLHKPSISFHNTDYLTLSIIKNNIKKVWRIVFRDIKNKSNNLYDVVSFPVDKDEKIILHSPDRNEFGGWVERNGKITNIFLRISYGSIDQDINKVSIGDLEKKWPPNDLESVRIELVRNDVDEFGRQDNLIDYEKEGEAILSLPALYKEHQLDDNIVTLTMVSEDKKSVEKIFTYPKNHAKNLIRGQEKSEKWWREFVEPMFGVLIQEPQNISYEYSIQNLPFYLKLERQTEVGTELRKRVFFWGLCIFIVVTIIGLALWIFVFQQINRLSKNASRLATNPLDSDDQLVYKLLGTEIGTLTEAFNSVLYKAREQAVEIKNEQAKRENFLRLQYEEEIKRREEILNTVGHDIRSPLQQLLAIHPQGSDERRPVERILRAVKRLYGEVAPEDVYAIEPLNLSEIDIADFVSIFVSNKKKTFPDLEYIGPTNGIIVKSEDIALEEIVDQIVCNAESFYIIGTQIEVKVFCDAGDAIISIANSGPPIPSNSLEKIFYLGVSIRERHSEVEHRGQGLYMAMGYVRKMGGSIIAKNIVGGVVFEVHLPLVI